MKQKFTNLVTVSLLLVFVITAFFPVKVLAATGGETDAGVLKLLAKVRQATKQYHDVEAAIADGFVQVSGCVASPDGGMGVHFAHFGRLADSAINPLEPELLLYEPKANGYKLVAVEYMLAIGPPGVPLADVVTVPPAPVLFGHPFDGPMEGHDGGPPHFDFHVWVWEANPNGTFAQFNPNVTCE